MYDILDLWKDLLLPKTPAERQIVFTANIKPSFWLTILPLAYEICQNISQSKVLLYSMFLCKLNKTKSATGMNCKV